MKRLPDLPLPNVVQQGLAGYQTEVDGAGNYEAQVAMAKRKFSQKNKRTDPVFAVVRMILTQMCAGAARCGYCEDSCADEVEHIYPKDLYPGVVFTWKNYLYACGICNREKVNQWAVFNAATGQLTEIRRNPDEPYNPPEAGEPAFIDPRQEEPLDLMMLDLRDTFRFVPVQVPGTHEYQRVEYTIETLELNREVLCIARKEAFGSYRARLREYIEDRDEGATQAELDDLICAIQRMGHPTVWREMKRQHQLIPRLNRLFQRAPEALAW